MARSRPTRSRRRATTLLLATLVVLPACGHLHWPRMPWAGSEGKKQHAAPLDLNRASLSKIEALPGITPSMAKRIVDGRPYENPGDLVRRDILTRRELQRIDDLVTVERPKD